MKATGIVRRIDDLGRVVIPKEIRRSMKIREGDPLEIYTTSEGGVVFKKYYPIDQERADNLKETLHLLLDQSFGVYDNHGDLICGTGIFQTHETMADNPAEVFVIPTFDGYGVTTHNKVSDDIRKAVRRILEHYVNN